MKCILLAALSVLSSFAILSSCSEYRDFQVRTVLVTITSTEIIEQYNDSPFVRVHYQEVDGWKMTFIEDVLIKDSAKYRVNTLYPVKIYR